LFSVVVFVRVLVVVKSDVIIFFFPFSLYQVFCRASFSLVSLIFMIFFVLSFFFEMRLMRIFFHARRERDEKRKKKEEF